jgi:hypothetical protein
MSALFFYEIDNMDGRLINADKIALVVPFSPDWGTFQCGNLILDLSRNYLQNKH